MISRQRFCLKISSRHTEKMVEQLLLAYALTKESATVIMMLYKNTKATVRSPEDDTEFFKIVSGVLQRGTLAPCKFII